MATEAISSKPDGEEIASISKEYLSGRWYGYWIVQGVKYELELSLDFADGSFSGSGKDVEGSPFQNYCNDYFDVVNGKRSGKSLVFERCHRRSPVSEKTRVWGSLEQCESRGGIVFNGKHQKGMHDSHEEFVMYKQKIPAFDSARLEQPFLQGLRKFHKDHGSLFSDLSVVLEDGSEVKAHKIILVSQCEYFSALFRQDPSSTLIHLEDFDSDVVRSAISFFYTAEPSDIDGVSAYDILLLANFLQMQSLVSLSSHLLSQNITKHNCVEVAELAYRINNPELLTPCIAFMAAYFLQLCLENKLDTLSNEIFLKILESDGKIVLRDEYGRFLGLQARQRQLLYLILSTIKSDRVEKNFLRKALVNFSPAVVESFDGNPPWRKHPSFEKLGVVNPDLLGLLRETFAAIPLEEFNKDLVDDKIGTFRSRQPLGTVPTPTPGQVARPWSLDCQQGKRCIRKIQVVRRLWDERDVVKGLVIELDDLSIHRFGVQETEPVELTSTFQVPDGQHIAYVRARSGWYIDQLEFVTNAGISSGSVGGGGGAQRILQNDFPDNVGLSKVYLDGIEGSTWIEQGGPIIGRVFFTFVASVDETF